MTGLSMSAEPSTLPEGVLPMAVDLRQRKIVEAAVAQVRADLIFHLAGYVTARQDRELVVPMFEANAASTINLLVGALNAGIQRFILVGSSETLSAEQGAVPSSPYTASKLVAEIYGQMFWRLYELPVVSVRPYLTYGPWQEPTKLIPYTILTLLRGERPLLTSCERACDVVYIEDVVRGLLMAAVAPTEVLGRRIDLGAGRGIPLREVVQAVVKSLGSPSDPVFGDIPDRIEEVAQVADLACAQSLLGWAPRWTLEEGLRETVAWYRQRVESGVTL